MPNVMAAQPNIGGALCDSFVIPLLGQDWLHGLTRPDRFFWASPFLFLVSSLFFFLFGSVRQIKLATRQLLGPR